MIKSGFSGSGINDIVWMGNVVNEASNLCHQGNKNGRHPVQVASVVYQNLCDEFKKLLQPVYLNLLGGTSQYEGDLFVVKMQNWLEAKKQTTQMNALAAIMQGQTAFSQATTPINTLWQLAQLPTLPKLK